MSETMRERFDRQVRELGGVPVYDEWLGVMKKHRVICKDGHEGTPNPNSVNRGQGICWKCSVNRRAKHQSETAEQEFIARVCALGGTPTYIRWEGSLKPHSVICKEGHACTPRPNDVQQGKGLRCRICAHNDPFTAEQAFIARIGELGAVCTYTKWLGTVYKHRVICKNGHECNTIPGNVSRGVGICRQCAGLRPYDCFYVVRNPRTYVVKYGVTSGDSRPRLYNHRSNGFTEQLYLKLSFEGAGSLEDAVDIALADAGYKPVRGQEYFRDDCLPYLLSLLPEP